jgi:glutamate--cysteine ligase
VTSAYQNLDRSDLRSALEQGAFARRDEGYALECEALALVERAGGVQAAWSDAAEQLEDVRAALREIPQLAIEPEGLVRVNSGVHPTATGAYRAAGAAFDALAARLKQWGMALVSCGADPWANSARVLSTVVRVPLGSPASAPTRWRAAEKLAPLSEAIFAFSPLREAASQGLRSCGAEQRFQSLSGPLGELGTRQPLDAYLDWTLDMPCDAAPRRLSFRAWAEHGVGGSFPDLADFQRHIARLRAPCKPEGGLALRAADSQARPFLSTPLVWWSVLLDDAACLSETSNWESPTRARNETAARAGLGDAGFADRARQSFALVADRLLERPGVYASPEMVAAFIAFGERFALRGRTPADEWLSRFARRGQFSLGDFAELEAHWIALSGVRRAE